MYAHIRIVLPAVPEIALSAMLATEGAALKKMHQHITPTSYMRVNRHTSGAGDKHSMVLKQDGSVWTAGENIHGCS